MWLRGVLRHRTRTNSHGLFAYLGKVRVVREVESWVGAVWGWVAWEMEEVEWLKIKRGNTCQK